MHTRTENKNMHVIENIRICTDNLHTRQSADSAAKVVVFGGGGGFDYDFPLLGQVCDRTTN